MPITGFDVWLQGKQVPAGTDFPGTVQGLVNLLAQYLQVAGLDAFNGINSGPDEPSSGSRDKVWYRVDTSGNPLGWYYWDGLAWAPVPIKAVSGDSDSRPESGMDGELFFDTDINTMLVWDRGKWRTASGSPGDIKEVKAETLAEALKRNPGWKYDADSVGMVIAGADDTVDESTADTDVNDHWYGNVVGEEYHNMTIEELVAHRHNSISTGNTATSWDAPTTANPYPVRAHTDGGSWSYKIGGTSTESTVGLSSKPVNNSGELIDDGGGEPFNVRQPTIYYWRLVKE